MNQKRHSSDELGVGQQTAECHLPCDGPPRHPRFQFAPGVIDGPAPPVDRGPGAGSGVGLGVPGDGCGNRRVSGGPRGHGDGLAGMSQPDIACPVCGNELTLAQIFSSEDTQRAFARLASVSIPLGSRVLQYCTLFAPPKTRLTVPKQVKLILSLLPDLERQVITARGRDWPAPLAAWALAIDQMLLARDTARLDLPMKGHGYLYSILVGMADKVEGQAEAQAAVAARTAPRQDTVQVRGQPMSIGAALGVVYGGVDPAIAKLNQDEARRAPMPAAQREHIAALLADAKQKGIKP